MRENQWEPFWGKLSSAGMTLTPPKAPASMTETGRIEPDTEGRFISSLNETASELFGQVLYWLPTLFIALSMFWLIGLLFAALSKDWQAVNRRLFGALVCYAMSFILPLTIFMAEGDIHLSTLIINGLETVRLIGLGAALLAVFISWRFFWFGSRLIKNDTRYETWSKKLLWIGVSVGLLVLSSPLFLP